MLKEAIQTEEKYTRGKSGCISKKVKNNGNGNCVSKKNNSFPNHLNLLKIFKYLKQNNTTAQGQSW
jgi:hypothetical protein